MDGNSQFKILFTLVPASLEYALSLAEMEVLQRNFFTA
jgi:hypothetical protein